jgi:hypothetical protein
MGGATPEELERMRRYADTLTGFAVLRRTFRFGRGRSGMAARGAAPMMGVGR